MDEARIDPAHRHHSSFAFIQILNSFSIMTLFSRLGKYTVNARWTLGVDWLWDLNLPKAVATRTIMAIEAQNISNGILLRQKVRL
jgi:hypothetical protein